MAEIYVRLLGEAVDVWRPVQAEHLGGETYLILHQSYDDQDEKWEFTPGARVVGRIIDLERGPALGAVASAA